MEASSNRCHPKKSESNRIREAKQRADEVVAILKQADEPTMVVFPMFNPNANGVGASADKVIGEHDLTDPGAHADGVAVKRSFAIDTSEATEGLFQFPGLLKPNDFGLFDTLDNVTEWLHEPVTLAAERRATMPLVLSGDSAKR